MLERFDSSQDRLPKPISLLQAQGERALSFIRINKTFSRNQVETVGVSIEDIAARLSTPIGIL